MNTVPPALTDMYVTYIHERGQEVPWAAGIEIGFYNDEHTEDISTLDEELCPKVGDGLK